MKRIVSQRHLDALIEDKVVLDCFILLQFKIKSSKEISFENKEKDYRVYHYSDNTEDIIKHNEFEHSYLFRAIEAGALYYDQNEV